MFMQIQFDNRPRWVYAFHDGDCCMAQDGGYGMSQAGAVLEEEKGKYSRRAALKALGGLTAGAAVTGLAWALPAKAYAEQNGRGAQHPWPYARLDVEQVRKLGHKGYYLGNCSSGAFYAIMLPLQEAVGSPYTEIPIMPPGNMMHFGGGGIGAGMCCGALLGAFAAVNLVTDSGSARTIVAALLEWYKTAPFPSDISNEYGRERKFLLDRVSSDEVIVQTVAHSAFCEDSVINWIIESGYTHGDDQRKERCARLTGDVAAKAVELLNG